MALLPKSNLNGLPTVTADDLKNADPARLNRTLSLLASQIQSLQTGKPTSTGITNQTIIQNISGGGGSGGGGSSSGGSSIGGIYPMASSGGLSPDPSAAFTQQAVLGGNASLNPPVSIVPGRIFLVQLDQDATGGHVVTFDNFYTGVSTVTVDTTASTRFAALFQIQTNGLSAQLIQIAMNGSPVA